VQNPVFLLEFLWNHVRFEKWGAVNHVPISVVVVVAVPVVVAVAVVVLIPSPVFCCLNLSVQMVEIMLNPTCPNPSNQSLNRDLGIAQWSPNKRISSADSRMDLENITCSQNMKILENPT
jgi:hypothetical protein